MIRTYTGPMFSDKSASLIDIYRCIWNKDIVAAFKPRHDTRDGSVIKSKKYPNIEIPAIFVDTTEEIKESIINGNFRTVFIDEAEFLKGDVRELVDLSVILNVDFYIAGLNMTSELSPFGIMADLLAVSDEITHIRGYCQDCNKPSYYSYFLGGANEEAGVGDNYISLCPECFKRRMLSKNGQRLTLRSM
ncbi:MAG: hypothetical protein J1F35_07040 [Erysipelotrichales bacterium]|nr:hypothetical protein [Erysipelotrichales bacterium]